MNLGSEVNRKRLVSNPDLALNKGCSRSRLTLFDSVHISPYSNIIYVSFIFPMKSNEQIFIECKLKNGI